MPEWHDKKAILSWEHTQFLILVLQMPLLLNSARLDLVGKRPDWTASEVGVWLILEDIRHRAAGCHGIVRRRSLERFPDSNTGIEMMRTEDLEFQVTEGSIKISRSYYLSLADEDKIKKSLKSTTRGW